MSRLLQADITDCLERGQSALVSPGDFAASRETGLRGEGNIQRESIYQSENDSLSLAKQKLLEESVALPAPFNIQIANSKQKKNALGDEILLELLSTAA